MATTKPKGKKAKKVCTCTCRTSTLEKKATKTAKTAKEVFKKTYGFSAELFGKAHTAAMAAYDKQAKKRAKKSR